MIYEKSQDKYKADVKGPMNSTLIHFHERLKIMLLYENSNFHGCCVFRVK